MMEQEAKSVEIQRYAMKSIEVYAEEVEAPDGYWVSYADHIAALAAKDAAISALKGAVHADVAEFRRDSEQIGLLREALWHISECGECGGCHSIAVAVLASTAPVAEAGQKDGEL